MMKFVTLCLCLGFSLCASAAEYRRGENINLTGHFTDNIFAAGGQVNADFTSSDDAFIAGRHVNFNAQLTEHAYLGGSDLHLTQASAREATVAGGNLIVDRSRFRELVIAGGDVNIDRTDIADDLVLAGGAVHVGKLTVVGGALTLAGGNIHFDGRVKKDALLTGDTVDLGGNFAGNVRVYANRLVVEPGTIIGGSLSHSARLAEISPDARIAGTTQVVPPPESATPWPKKGWGILWGALFGIGCLILPALLVALFPTAAAMARNQIRRNFWEDLGKGFVVFIVAPIVVIILFMSIVGLPVGLAAIPFLIAAGLFAWSLAVYTTGDQLKIWLMRRQARSEPVRGSPSTPQVMTVAKLNRSSIFGWTILGAVALMIALWVPVAGVLLCIVLFFVGVGSLYSVFRSRHDLASPA